MQSQFCNFTFYWKTPLKSFKFVKIQFLCSISRPWGLQCEALVSTLLHQFVCPSVLTAHCKKLKGTTLGLHTSLP
jgi:hypothetical protein